MGDLWATRRQAETALSETLQSESEFIGLGFDLLDLCIRDLSRIDSAFGRVCTGTSIKGRNLALGCYSLTLDALAQEGGALFRPLIEVAQLLTYFSQDRSRVDEMLDNHRLPRAGEIARNIDGPSFQQLRNYLNEHASHFSFTFESMQHFFGFRSGEWSITQTYKDEVLRQNLGTLYAALYLLLLGVAQCLSASNAFPAEMADTIDHWRQLGITTFFPEFAVDGSSDEVGAENTPI